MPVLHRADQDDEQALIVARGEHAYVLLNLFPYNSGHLLVCPYRHVATYDEATAGGGRRDRHAHADGDAGAHVSPQVRRLQHRHEPGRIAGAGIAEHLHQHIVPRWAQDANFFPIIAGTKALPRLLGEVREAIADAWPRYADPPVESESVARAGRSRAHECAA